MQIQGLGQLNGVNQVQPKARFNQVNQPSKPAPSSSFGGPDQLEISQEAQTLSQIREVPEIRADRVAAIRAEIASGAYETPEKIDLALDRLLDEIG